MNSELIKEENVILTLRFGERPGVEDFSTFSAYPDQEISCSFFLGRLLEWSVEHELTMLLKFSPFLGEVLGFPVYGGVSYACHFACRCVATLPCAWLLSDTMLCYLELNLD